MKHFQHLSDELLNRLFFIKPADFDKDTELERLKYALGAALYIPAVKTDIFDMLVKRKYLALTTVVLCLEDAIGIEQTNAAMQNLNGLFIDLASAVDENRLSAQNLPLIFIRIRERSQLEKLLNDPFVRQFACGFVLPKYDAKNGECCLKLIDFANKKYGSNLYALPLIESAKVIDKRTRIVELAAIKSSLDAYRHLVLNIRVGGTDFSGLYGLRRGVDFSIYDLRVVSDCLADIINIFNLENDDTVISGPVWEHFSSIEDTQKITMFMKQGKDDLSQQSNTNATAVYGLIKETKLDIANGFIGKTIIHPSQIAIVNAFQAVTYEEYADAKNIVTSGTGGVEKSLYHNKMNEVSPHIRWAKKIMKRAAVYGVLNPNESFTSLF